MFKRFMLLFVLFGLLPFKAAAGTPLRVQLKWVDQAQFAGYYAALDQGYYAAQGLDVTLLPGGPSTVPEQVVSHAQAEFGIDFLPSLLTARESGLNLVNIAQIFTRSGTREIAFKQSGIKTVADLKNKRVGAWSTGNAFELYAALVKYKMDPENADDLHIVQQPFDMSLLLNGQVDAAAAMIYNEYAQLLETRNPQTGQLFTENDLNVIDFNKEDTAMLQDGLFAAADWLTAADHAELTRRFLMGTFQGWAYCRDHATDCVQMVIKRGGQLSLAGHQLWMMNKINELIWPTSLGIGVMDADLFDQTVAISLKYGVISQTPDRQTFRASYAIDALHRLGSTFDGHGFQFKPLTVQLTEGGR